jgi:hypothetical protein
MTAEAAPSLHHLRSPRRALLLWLLLAALFARGLVAPGFMPQFGAGGVGIVLCTPQGPKTLWQAGDALGGGQHAGGEHCAFGLALGMAAATGPATAALVLAAESTPVAARPQPAIVSWRERGTSARGPPSHS